MFMTIFDKFCHFLSFHDRWDFHLNGADLARVGSDQRYAKSDTLLALDAIGECEGGAVTAH